MTGRVPVIAITGHLGAGKTTLLNHVLRAPGARIGVIVNDFGALNVDAALTSGQIDEVAGISGGCLCCLPDAGGLDDALKKFAHPRLQLDAIMVEASEAADPVALARLLHFSAVDGIRFGGIVEVIDAVEHFRTVDTWPDPPMRYAAATLVVIGKTDLLPAGERERRIERIGRRVRQRNWWWRSRAGSIPHYCSTPRTPRTPRTNCPSPLCSAKSTTTMGAMSMPAPLQWRCIGQ